MSPLNSIAAGSSNRLAWRAAVTLVVLLLTFCPAVAGWSEAAGVKVGIIGDQTWSSDLAASYRLMERGISLLAEQGADIIIHTGDIVESSADAAKISRDFTRASALLDQAGIPWYPTAGDHDVNPPVYAQDSPDRSRERLFLSLVRQRRPGLTNLYYSFDRGPYHFIVLYSGEHLHTDPRWGNVFLSRIGTPQYEWLHRDLEANRHAKAIVVFLHQPMWYNWNGWARIHRLLRDYPVAAVVAGHFHYPQDEGTLDGIRYMVVGAAGAQIKSASPEAGGVHHVTLMVLDEDGRADFHPLAISPTETMTLASRRDMDRVQALDYSLGSLGDFTRTNKVFLGKGSVLVNDCSSRSPAQLTLTAPRNAIEVPLTMTIDITSSSPSVQLKSSEFDRDACLASGGLMCILKPSYGVSAANTSSVTVDEKSKPLWTGTLRLEENHPPPPGITIALAVTLSFRGDNDKVLTLSHRTGNITVLSCPR